MSRRTVAAPPPTDPSLTRAPPRAPHPADLADAQSYPFIMALDTGELFRRDVDGEGHYGPRDILEGAIVVANVEVGYWSTSAARRYPNPLLVKLCRGLWQICPDAAITGECHWGRGGALLRSGVLPHSLDVVSAMASGR